MSDLIKREDAIKEINNAYSLWNAESLIRRIPSADRPKGEWIEINIKDYKAKCSNCRTWSVVMGNFCPECGADMRGADNE